MTLPMSRYHEDRHDRQAHAAILNHNHRAHSYYDRDIEVKQKPRRPIIKHYRTDPIIRESQHFCDDEDSSTDSTQTSLLNEFSSSGSTYASTEASREEFADDSLPLEWPIARHEPYPSEAIPTTPVEFADLFPSMRRLRIRHDDATLDGNMNLRVDTSIHRPYGRSRDMILFHLRMKDLHARQYSLRRYCRESGREVCHSNRKAEPPRRPVLQRSLSSALNTFGIKSDSTKDGGVPLKRHDSGYQSIRDGRGGPVKPPTEGSSSITTLEFSNYAHVDVRKSGIGHSKHYDFEFWGKKYSWKRHITRTAANTEQISFHLYQSSKSISVTHINRSSKIVAHIIPDIMTPHEAYEEKCKGGWVPPCSMWISDRSILGGLTDVADVVVATGLIALVDCSIKRQWHRNG